MTHARLWGCAAIAVCVTASAHETGTPASTAACLAPATWYSIADGKPRARAQAELLDEAARLDIVLLGEHHADPDHHQWQLQTLAALHLLRPNMAIGFEAFPRRLQSVLDQWIAGELTQRQFLERAQWSKVWNFPAELYLPLFNFARLNRIPILALNVERTLTEEISRKGWDAIPAAQLEGVSRPAAAPREYEDYLFDVFKQHARGKEGVPSRSDPGFRHFVESQLTWDRAMAEALASRVKTARAPQPLVVGIMGAGHVRDGHGVPHQLRDLGLTRIAALLPLESDTPCSEISPRLADAVFALPAARRDQPPPPRLGVSLEMKDKAVAVATVTPGSLAEQTGIKPGDLLVRIAGAPVLSTATVIAAVRRQPAGTWLPLQIRRGETTLEIVIKFPPKT